MRGRIIKGVGGLYSVACDDGKIYKGKARGLLRKQGIKPAIGDYAEITPNGDECVIVSIHERKNMLIRPKAANIDCAVIVFASANPDINFDLLDRFLILAESRSIEDIIICINKCDLEVSEGRKKAERIYKGIYPVCFVSAESGEGIDGLKSRLRGKVSVLAGPSGVGKSSIINRIVPFGNMETGEISEKIRRGRHTTRHIELLQIDSGSYIMDTPGFSSVDTDSLDPESLPRFFREFAPYLTGCYYRDCRHMEEPGCILKEQVGTNILTERYERYRRMYNEIKKGLKKY